MSEIPRPISVERPQDHRFYLGMACAFALIAIAGFTPSYWARVASGTFDSPPIYHVHGLLLFSWIAFYLVQTALVAAGRTPSHRTWGMAGIALFSIMVCSTVALGIHSMQAGDLLGFGDAGRQFSVGTFLPLILVAGLFATAIASIRRPDTHKRLMVLVMVVLVQAAVARLIGMTLALLLGVAKAPGPPPLISTIPTGLITDILIVVAMVHDWRTRGRPHGAYVWGGLAVLAVQLLLAPVGNSATWMSVAKALQGIMG